MKLVEMLGSTDIVRTNMSLDAEIKDIKYNSKNVEKGDVFVAINGNSPDGKRFITEALSKGALCIVCETEPDGDTPFVLVNDSRKALASMSKLFFGSPDEKLIMTGVTGTNGKTSTTYFIRHILTEKYGECVGLIGTNQNLVGNKSIPAKNTTPMSYDTYKLLREMADSGCKYCVMEVSSHALAQDRVHGIQFELGIFTNLTQDHLDFHGTFENYRNTKRKLAEISGTTIINADDGNFNGVAAKRIFAYSAKQENADIFAKNITFNGNKTKFDAVYKGKTYHISIPIPGMFTVYNSMAAISAAILLGAEMNEISLGLQSVKPVIGRCEFVPVNKPFDVMIDFAHTPDGMESVLSMARQITKGRIITVFGCGGDRDKSKRPIMGKIAAEYSDKVIITSDNARTENPLSIAKETLEGIENADVDMILDREKAIHYAMDIARKGDLVMLLGKGHELYIEKDGKRTYFNERDIVMSHK
ncbi:MAG: UDP-N-acetylmuramoyl-L-alanyl-D-glutamate--2,6-diaminopimelate ligase [Clostridia bacterium]|nr:UDP-N-acetylmuramoyl-L-alanyl-D-glutamate--2,6-diaminopimelate ligase [Clostridia bacterium]